MQKNNITIVKDIIKPIIKNEKITKIILFGSRARGDNEERSDIDLAICAPNMTYAEWLAMREVLEEADTLLEIDVVRFENASSELRKKIIEEGVIIYERRSKN